MSSLEANTVDIENKTVDNIVYHNFGATSTLDKDSQTVNNSSQTLSKPNILKNQTLGIIKESINSDHISQINFLDDLTYSIIKNNINSNINNISGDDSMDKLLEKYIDKMDRDQSDLRNDIRASESRTARSIELSEERNIERFNRIEQMINEHNSKIDEKYEKLESKIDNNNKFIISLSITTILGIAAMVVAVILSVK